MSFSSCRNNAISTSNNIGSELFKTNVSSFSLPVNGAINLQMTSVLSNGTYSGYINVGYFGSVAGSVAIEQLVLIVQSSDGATQFLRDSIITSTTLPNTLIYRYSTPITISNYVGGINIFIASTYTGGNITIPVGDLELQLYKIA
jgi:hypothetical protein